MNTEFENGSEFERQLRDGMTRFTDGAGQPRGLAVKAFARRQHRRATARGVTVVGAVTALTGGAVAAGVTGAFSAPAQAGGHSGTGPQYQTTSYVIRRVESALAASGRRNVLSFVRKQYQPGAILEPVGPGVMFSGSGSSATAAWAVGYSLSWNYHDTVKVESFTAAGQPVFSDAISATAQGAPTSTVVIYRDRTWWTATGTPQSGGSPPRCTTGIQLSGGPGNGWPAFIRSQLACGEYQVVGRQRVDGVNAIKISGDQGRDTLWVSPASYLPVRTSFDLGGDRTQSDFRWLAPTKANLAKLHLTVPAGYQQVPPPA